MKIDLFLDSLESNKLATVIMDTIPDRYSPIRVGNSTYFLYDSIQAAKVCADDADWLFIVRTSRPTIDDRVRLAMSRSGLR